MALYKQWEELAQQERTQQEHDAFWSAYFDKETEAYKNILTGNDPHLVGTVHELAERYGMEDLEFAGFLDGINDSLTKELKLDKLKADSKVDVIIDFEKLYYNMHRAKAPWLYQLEAWDGVLSKEKREEIFKQFKMDSVYHSPKVPGRNDPCPCGSGKKYKKCCGMNA